jgi:hypothetical protein
MSAVVSTLPCFVVARHVQHAVFASMIGVVYMFILAAPGCAANEKLTRLRLDNDQLREVLTLERDSNASLRTDLEALADREIAAQRALELRNTLDKARILCGPGRSNGMARLRLTMQTHTA